ncbi:MAG: NAD-dependent deacylase [Anaerolineae bacterium]|jgi:NAD-dependent deacetylase
MNQIVEGPVVAVTGAGVSAESGIPTFRGSDGLWRSFRPEDLATPAAFRRDPSLVWEWYDWRRQLIAGCHPNPAHSSLAEMERALSDFTLVTQNVDGLHRAAGSRRVLRLHGDIWRVRCTACGRVREDRRVPLPQLPPRCTCGGLLRPDVIWFNEPLPSDVLEMALEASARCQWMLVIGTSALVQPAASLPLVALRNGARLVEINLRDTPLTYLADEVLRGPAGEVLPRWWAEHRPAGT